MSLFERWITGVVIIIIFSISIEAILYFHTYVYTRLGVSKNIIMILLWTVPMLVSLYIAYTAEKYNIVLGLSYIPVVIVSLLLFHYINGSIGGKIDLIGFAGLKALFPILLVASSIACGIGTFLGAVLKKFF